jgi:ABC-type glutathione transport system ATPase component
MIDDAGEIGVLVIDPDLHVMAAIADLAVEMGHGKFTR